jgi:sugar O-acyltransferase (sialic acid O-acetyltransferase NeuD family)
MIQVVIIGAGGHGQVVADILLAGLKGNRAPSVDGAPSTDDALSIDSPAVQPVGFVDDDARLQGRIFLGLPVLGTLAQLPTIRHQAIVVAIGNNQTRQKIYRWLIEQGEQLVGVHHPSAIIGGGVEIGEGAVISAGVIINTGAQIGQNVILNTACIVEHHNRVGDHVHIAPGVRLGGDVEIGPGALIGIGATVVPQRRIGAWSIVGAGAVVTEDVPAFSTVVGVPARVIKVNQATFAL